MEMFLDLRVKICEPVFISQGKLVKKPHERQMQKQKDIKGNKDRQYIFTARFSNHKNYMYYDTLQMNARKCRNSLDLLNKENRMNAVKFRVCFY